MVKRKSGHIVFIGSQAGIAVDWVKQHGPYTSAKAAVMALGTTLRPEAEEHGVGKTFDDDTAMPLLTRSWRDQRDCCWHTDRDHEE